MQRVSNNLYADGGRELVLCLPDTMAQGRNTDCASPDDDRCFRAYGAFWSFEVFEALVDLEVTAEDDTGNAALFLLSPPILPVF